MGNNVRHSVFVITGHLRRLALADTETRALSRPAGEILENTQPQKRHTRKEIMIKSRAREWRITAMGMEVTHTAIDAKAAVFTKRSHIRCVHGCPAGCKSVGSYWMHLPQTFWFFLECLLHWRVRICLTTPTSAAVATKIQTKFWKIPNHKRDTAERCCIP